MLKAQIQLVLNLHKLYIPDLAVVEQIISVYRDAGITKEIKKDIEIANLLAVSEIDDDFENGSQTIYERRYWKKLVLALLNLDHFLHQEKNFLKELF